MKNEIVDINSSNHPIEETNLLSSLIEIPENWKNIFIELSDWKFQISWGIEYKKEKLDIIKRVNRLVSKLIPKKITPEHLIEDNINNGEKSKVGHQIWITSIYISEDVLNYFISQKDYPIITHVWILLKNLEISKMLNESDHPYKTNMIENIIKMWEKALEITSISKEITKEKEKTKNIREMITRIDVVKEKLRPIKEEQI